MGQLQINKTDIISKTTLLDISVLKQIYLKKKKLYLNFWIHHIIFFILWICEKKIKVITKKKEVSTVCNIVRNCHTFHIFKTKIRRLYPNSYDIFILFTKNWILLYEGICCKIKESFFLLFKMWNDCTIVSAYSYVHVTTR